MTIFHEPWWLDAVAPGRWEEVRVERDGAVVARWPYVVRRGPGPLVRLLAPPLSPRLGPVMDASMDPRSDLAGWTDALGELAGRLPAHHHLIQACDPALTEWLPLSWRGFTHTTRYSFVLRDIGDLDRVRAGYAQGRRGDYRKGLRLLELREGSPPGPTYPALQATLARAGAKVGFSHETFTHAVAAATSRSRGLHLSAHGPEGDQLAGAFLVWDDTTLYYLVGGAAAEARGSGAQTLLVDRGIELAASKGLAFDFEGSRVESIAKFFASFGAAPEPYPVVERRSPGVSVLLGIRAARSGRRRRTP
jgi:hypothetical protein